MQNKKTTLYLALFFVFLVGWWGAKTYLFPPPPPAPKDEGDGHVVKSDRTSRRPAAVAAAGPFADLVPEPERIDRPVRHPAQKIVLGPQANLMPPPAVKPQEVTRRITLGSDDPQSKYHLKVVLDARGAGVRRVVLNKFQAVDDRGQPEWQDPETKKVRKLLELVPEDVYDANALSYLLYHFDLKNANKDEGGEQPLDTLGQVAWKVVEPAEENSKGESSATRVVFQTTIGGVVIQKVFTLNEGEYHVGLEVRMFKAVPDDKDLWFRYQIEGAHGLPIESKWSTNTFRNALIAQVDKANNASVARDLQDARSLALKEGGDEILHSDPSHFIRYAAVAIQYFASAIVVSEDQENQEYLSRARPTMVTAAVKGTLRSVGDDGSTFILNVGDKYDLTFRVEKPALRDTLRVLPPGAPLGVVHRTDLRGRSVVMALQQGSKTQPLFEDDITVRVATAPINLKDATEEKPVVHKYLLYNGPMKPMLLGHMKEPATVSDELVDRYVNKLSLNTLVDYHSPGYMGTFANTIGWTYLVIKTTNLMHWVLGLLSSFLPYGLCIIVLTIMVRGMMFPVSRKAAMTNIRMQQLQPEIKKLKEKHKDDPQALNMAVWALQRKSGVNPLSTCWLMFLQMPIFMGLYYALQESIHFRAAPFWPTWIHNLAAPDMLFYWGESIPFISAPESYGNFIYLGPYFNILPVIAVTLMILQQKYTMPPPTDEQQEMQQKMMKYMMVFMGLMFYKVPSGLVLYFIASSIWGFTERKLLPKKKPLTEEDAGPQKESLMEKLMAKVGGSKAGDAASAVDGSTGVTVNGNVKSEGKGRNRVKKGKNKARIERAIAAEAGRDVSDSSGSVFRRLGNWWRERRERMNNWWEKIQEEAQKKNR